MRPRIVAFANADYIPVARNWLQKLRAIGLETSATLVALDDETSAAFPAERVLHRPLALGPSGLGALWVHRIQVLRDFLAAGEAVIHSDVDAIWLRDPLPDIQACTASAVFSQGTVWPPDVHRRHGLVLCCGFFHLSPQPEILAFLDAVAVQVETDRDDQIAVNRVVAGMIADWHIEDPYEIAFRDTRFLASRSPIRSRLPPERPDTLSIAVLPHHAYPRLLDAVTAETVVAHPLSGKTCSEKRQCLTDLGLWSAQTAENL